MTDTTASTELGRPVPIEPDGLISRISQNIRKVATVSEIMRMLGALIMVTSMSLFLLQSWNQGSDVNRYFLLLIQTVLMAGGGLALSFLLKENKGARVFFNLSLISVVTNFTILGALIYSTVQWDSALKTYPQYATWVVQSDQSIMLAMMATAVVLLPVVLFGFMITARPVAFRLSALYLVLNALLLLPIRDSLPIGMLVLLGLLMLPWLLKKICAEHKHFNTPGGHFIKVLLFAPLLILLIRSAMWYTLDNILILSLSLAIFISLRSFALKPGTQNGNRLITAVDLVSFLSSFGVTAGIYSLAEIYLPATLQIPAAMLALAVLNHELSTRVHYKPLRTLIMLLTASTFAGGFIFNMVSLPIGWPALLCLTAGLMIIAYSGLYKQRWLLLPGIVAVLSVLTVNSEYLFELLRAHSPTILAIIGATIIILASLLERHGVALKLKMQQ